MNKSYVIKISLIGESRSSTWRELERITFEKRQHVSHVSQFRCQPSLPILFLFYITAAEIRKENSELAYFKSGLCGPTPGRSVNKFPADEKYVEI